MPDSTLDRALGRLEGKLDALMRATAESDKRTYEHRAKTHEHLEEITTRTAKLERETIALRDDVDGFKPFVSEARRWRERGIGAAMVFSSMGALFGGAFVAFKDNVMRLLGVPS